MSNLFRRRITQYLSWWLKRNKKSPKIVNLLVVIVLCIGLFVVGLFQQEPPRAQSSQEAFSHYPVRLTCSIERIIDGDSIIAKCPIKKGHSTRLTRSIRVFGIDAPELGQKKWGSFAKKTLIGIIGQSQNIELEFLEQDRYKRFIAKVYSDDVNVGLEMVKQGAAIVYHRYNKDEDYINAEKKAKMMRLGIWKTKGAQQNPEKWRRFNP